MEIKDIAMKSMNLATAVLCVTVLAAGFTRAAAQPQTATVLKVTDFHAVGDGSTDDTTALQKAIDTAISRHATLQVPPGPHGGCYASGSLVIRNADHFILEGTGGVICWRGGEEGAPRIGLGYAGTLSDVTIEGLEITGVGPDEMHHAGIAGPSGATLRNITIRKNYIHDVSLGISLNADTSGVIDGFVIESNKIENVIGTPPGYGYGIHHANGSGKPSNGRIVGNTLIGCQRNSIYEAKGSGVIIANNTILNHGGGRPTPSSPLTGIQAARGSDILVIGNVIENPTDGAIDVGTDSGFPIRDVTVIGNTVRNPGGVIAAVTIGSAYPATDGFPEQISVIANTIVVNGQHVIPLQINCGKHINVVGNTIRVLRPPATTPGIQIRGQQETPGPARFTDQLNLSQNEITIERGGGNPGSAIEFTPTAAASTITTRLSGNAMSAPGGPVRFPNGQPGRNLTMAEGTRGGHIHQQVNLNGEAPSSVPGCSSTVVRNVSGAAVGDAVRATSESDLHLNFILEGSVTAPGEVTVKWCQLFGPPTDPDGPGGNYIIDVWKP